ARIRAAPDRVGALVVGAREQHRRRGRTRRARVPAAGPQRERGDRGALVRPCRRAAVARTLALLAFGASACEGGGDAGKGLVVELDPIAPNCAPVGGTFPSGLALLSQASHRAALAQTSPPGVGTFDVEAERPRSLAFRNIGTDSDGDGEDDAAAI